MNRSSGLNYRALVEEGVVSPLILGAYLSDDACGRCPCPILGMSSHMHILPYCKLFDVPQLQRVQSWRWGLDLEKG
jgi:hypothetical protein